MDGITDPMDMSLCKFWKIEKDRGAWWAAVYGVAQSQTRLKRLAAAACMDVTVGP